MDVRGVEGTAGRETSGGSGGRVGFVPTQGTPQDAINQIKWKSGDSGPVIEIYHHGLTSDFTSGQPAAGHGGSLVYLYANTTSTISGTKVQLINNTTGLMKSGGGGGSAGSDTAGLSGGNLGRPGGLPSDTPLLVGQLADTPTGGNAGTNWEPHSRRGEPGKLVWWNSDNLTSDYTIVNNSPNIDNSIEGLDYNSSIEGWDYVSYTPSITVATSEQEYWNLSGLKLWSRRADAGVVYSAMAEQSFFEYFNQLGGTIL
jgi:hypothetical protein